MKHKIFTVHDVAADAFATPFVQKTTGLAIRSFAQACQDENTQLHQHPSDYTLFQIGEFDEDTGEITPCTPFSVAKALDYAQTSTQLKAVNDDA